MSLELLNYLQAALLIPLGAFILYLTKHIKDKDGSVSKIRKIILVVKITWFIYFLTHVGITYSFSVGHIPTSTIFIITFVTLLVNISHWWALIQFYRMS